MLHIGCHLSSAKGFLAMGKEAAAMKANTFAFFTRNPRGGKAKDINPTDADAFLAFHREHNFVRLVAHAPYTMNLCAAKENIRTFALEMLTDDLRRMEVIPGNYYKGTSINPFFAKMFPLIKSNYFINKNQYKIMRIPRLCAVWRNFPPNRIHLSRNKTLST